MGVPEYLQVRRRRATSTTLRFTICLWRGIFKILPYDTGQLVSYVGGTHRQPDSVVRSPRIDADPILHSLFCSVRHSLSGSKFPR